ncbi:hypothetical protein [Bosea sp. (in: a-proteobacteria)]|nr:hypothetical protein [Bosea sp. (in: a-proteobacteria)]WRH56108.1 MAG: hypothetical protein RSE11_13700 [Bosea sp. (in: a-proteobacteria)]
MAENLTRLRRIITFHPYAPTGEMRQRTKPLSRQCAAARSSLRFRL